MKKYQIAIALVSLVLLSNFAIGQIISTPIFPPNFSYELPLLPLPLSEQQIIFNNCPYKFPILLSASQVYEVNGTNFNPLVTAEIQLMTDGNRSMCSYRKTFSLPPSLDSTALISNFQMAMNNELIAQANANTQPYNPPAPISTTGGLIPNGAITP